MEYSSFIERLNNGEILISDGATGTNLQKRGLTPGIPPELWVLENPVEILKLHEEFINAGSNIILTCTFGGTRTRLEHSNLGNKANEINQKAVEIAQKAASGKSVLIAGSIGPTGQLIKPLGTLEEDEALQDFYSQAKVLSECGVDLLVIETHYDLTEANAAFLGARNACNLPIVVSFSYDRGTRTMMGVRPRQMAEKFSSLDIQALGINCGRSIVENEANLKELHEATRLPIWFKPNAGLPVLSESGESSYNLDPETMGEYTSKWIEFGASVIGGCCGSRPEHIRSIADTLQNLLKNR